MNELALHPTTKDRVLQLEKSLPQALLLSGVSGVGLATIARALAGSHLAGMIYPQDAKDKTDHEKGTITAEVIRRLYEQTRAKYTKQQIIIIDDADRMSLPAQNAFLKLLEEPGGYIYFILTSHAPQLLIPTIRSRVQSLEILPITQTQTDNFLTQIDCKDPQQRAKLSYIASGLPAEMLRLHNDPSLLDAKATITKDARDFLLGTPYQKLIVINTYHADRDKALGLIDAVLILARRSLSSKPQHALVSQLDQLLTARTHVLSNYNVRLQLLRLVV